MCSGLILTIMSKPPSLTAFKAKLFALSLDIYFSVISIAVGIGSLCSFLFLKDSVQLGTEDQKQFEM